MTKLHTTNYSNTFIQIADDCPIEFAEIPPVKKSGKTAANIQFEMISKHPYKYSSDDVLFQVYADKNDLTKDEYKTARLQFFSKGQPCFRASPLTKRYGWGVHYDEQGKMALYAAGSEEYQKFFSEKNIQILKAMKSSK